VAQFGQVEHVVFSFVGFEDAEGDAICTTGNQRNESYFRFFHLAHSRFHSHGWASLVEVDDEFHYMK
jgi:hypothetical protein